MERPQASLRQGQLLPLLLLLLSLLSLPSAALGGTATAEVPFDGTTIGLCSSTSCGSGAYYASAACSDDSVGWANGTRQFLDPVPPGNIVVSASVQIFGQLSCGQESSIAAMVSVSGSSVGTLPSSSYDNCTCINCVDPDGVDADGANSNSGWNGYQYGTNNDLSLTLVSQTISCVSYAIVTLEYREAVPAYQLTKPDAAPLSVPLEVTVLGEDFLPSEDGMPLACMFGNETAAASYSSYNLIICDAPSSDVTATVSLTVSTAGVALDCGTYLFYEEPTLSYFEPTSGSSTGNYDVYVFGEGFFNSSQISCKFSQNIAVTGLFANQSCIICQDPTDWFHSAGRSVQVAVSMNSVNYVIAPGNFTFTGYRPTASPSPSPPKATVTAAPSATPSASESGPILPGYAWAAIGLLAAMLLLVLLAVVIVLYTRWRSRRDGYERFPGGSGLLQDRASSLHSSSEHLLEEGANMIPIRELKGFKLLEKGSFGVIYQAQWRGTVIAVKKLPSAEMTEKQLREFYQEAALMRSLRHPNILQYLGIANAGGEICICMEYMVKGSLYRLLHSDNSVFRSRKIKSICLDTARGMNYLHQQQPPIIHRDLKSHNLLVGEHWRVKVCDFGLSRLVSQSNATMTACGTPSWTAPEVLRNERYTTKADVYGFGVVVWEMFARRDPFPGMPPFQIVFAVGTQGLRPDTSPDWPEEWVSLITDCWQEDPELRPTFEDILERLERLEEIP